MRQEKLSRKIVTHHPYAENIIDFIPVRKDYLELLEGDRRASEILAVFENYTENKLAQLQEEELEDDFFWFPKSAKQLRQDLYEGYGINTVSRALNKLVEKRFLERRNNPDPQCIFDRKLQYKFNASRIQQFLNDLYTSRQTVCNLVKTLKPQNLDSNSRRKT